MQLEKKLHYDVIDSDWSVGVYFTATGRKARKTQVCL